MSDIKTTWHFKSNKLYTNLKYFQETKFYKGNENVFFYESANEETGETK